jgi:MoaA/NifB/PqqE/SkfB family radical SAM enzyme
MNHATKLADPDRRKHTRRLSLPVVERETPAPAPLLAPPTKTEGDPFNSHKILNHFDRISAFVRGDLVYPITVEIDPTNVCNHRCQWCVSIEAHTGEVLEVSRFAALIDELKQSDVKSIVLKGGGEPTTHTHFIEMLDIARNSGMDIGLITNGSMPRRGSREKIVECCDWVRVSLDAATPRTHREIHGTSDFTRILQNVEYLTQACTDRNVCATEENASVTGKKSGPMVGLNFVAEPRNHQEMVDFARLGKSIGAAYVTIRCVFDPTNPLSDDMRAAMRAEAQAAKAIEGANFRVFLGNFTDRYLNADPNGAFPYQRCLGPNLIGIVGGDGEVYACCFLRGNKKFSFGNVNQQGFSDIWKSERRQDVMNAVYRGECNRVCAGGMTANRYNTYNEILNYLSAEEKKHANFA